MAEPLPDSALDQLFRTARSYNGWLNKDVSDEQLHAIYDLMKMGPTSANQQPARIVWCKSADAEIVAQIRELIATRVQPAVAGDGGNIEYRGFRDGVVYLQMQGACSGCPSSSATLKHGIEGLLKHYVPEVTEVRAA